MKFLSSFIFGIALTALTAPSASASWIPGTPHVVGLALDQSTNKRRCTPGNYGLIESRTGSGQESIVGIFVRNGCKGQFRIDNGLLFECNPARFQRNKTIICTTGASQYQIKPLVRV